MKSTPTRYRPRGAGSHPISSIHGPPPAVMPPHATSWRSRPPLAALGLPKYTVSSDGSVTYRSRSATADQTRVPRTAAAGSSEAGGAGGGGAGSAGFPCRHPTSATTAVTPRNHRIARSPTTRQKIFHAGLDPRNGEFTCSARVGPVGTFQLTAQGRNLGYGSASEAAS